MHWIWGALPCRSPSGGVFPFLLRPLWPAAVAVCIRRASLQVLGLVFGSRLSWRSSSPLLGAGRSGGCWVPSVPLLLLLVSSDHCGLGSSWPTSLGRGLFGLPIGSCSQCPTVFCGLSALFCLFLGLSSALCRALPHGFRCGGFLWCWGLPVSLCCSSSLVFVLFGCVRWSRVCRSWRGPPVGSSGPPGSGFVALFPWCWGRSDSSYRTCLFLGCL